MLHDEVIKNENKTNEPIKEKDFYSDTYHLAKTTITTSPKNFKNVYSRTGFE